MKYTNTDLKQIEKKGLTVQKVDSQIQLFKKGVPYINLSSAATLKHGVTKVSKESKSYYINFFDSKRHDISILKFVPASGAATRMFKTLFNFSKAYNPEYETINSYINKNKEKELSIFLVGFEKLPFYKVIAEKVESLYPNYNTLPYNNQVHLFVKTMLDEEQLNYGFFPKGLLPFHKYKDHIATAFEEHFFEAALYASSNNQAHLHFTISEKHKAIFENEFMRIKEIVERKTNTKFYISFSYQKESTDTISVTPQNEPFRDDHNNLFFRPSGHGALLQNLNEMDAEVIFIKNIDNVVVSKFEKEVADYKKMLAGILLETQSQAFKYLELLDKGSLTEEDLIVIAQFVSQKMSVSISTEFEKYSNTYQIAYLIDKLNRPIRVCGMVKNEGEPGGGPFWVKDQSGQISLQIVESAQIDKKNNHQKDILKGATHFNPVDLVCGIRNYKGEKFDLNKFVDHKTAFITMKTKVGKDIKALELPGLWNGSMANWNTIFVEVPLITFNPVKAVTDLLKISHQVSE